MNDSLTRPLTDVTASIPSWQELFDVLSFQAGFNTSIVITGATLLGIAAGTIGTFALLRDRALMGDALAHSTLPGLAIAFIIASFLGFEGRTLWVLLTGATLSGILGVLCVQLLVDHSRLQQDTAIGVVLSCFFGAGIVLMSVIQNLGTGQEGGLHHFIYGQTAAMNRSDAYIILSIALTALFICVAFLKEFRLVCFDEGFARSDGWPVTSIDLCIMSLIVLVTVVGLQAVGLLLVVALLIIPAAAARFWTERLSIMTITSGAIGGLSGYLGASASAMLPRLPAGAVIVLVAGGIFLTSFLLAPRRGALSTLFSSLFLRVRIAKEHLLREAFELRESSGEDPFVQSDTIKLQQLSVTHGWSKPFTFLLLGIMRVEGILQKTNDGIQLSELGSQISAKKTRNHRLWEEYLISHSELSPSQIDYSADFVEHFISSEIVEQLEHSLQEKGRLQPETKVPESIHSFQNKISRGE